MWRRVRQHPIAFPNHPFSVDCQILHLVPLPLPGKDEGFLLSLLALAIMCWTCTSGDVSSIKAKCTFPSAIKLWLGKSQFKMQGNNITLEEMMYSAGPPHKSSTKHYFFRVLLLDLVKAVIFLCRTLHFWKRLPLHCFLILHFRILNSLNWKHMAVSNYYS